MMFYSSFLKQATIIGLIIKPDYCIYFYFFEYWYVILWCKQYGFIVGRAESYEFARNYPIDITILYFFVVFILSNIKFFVVKPAESYCIV